MVAICLALVAAAAFWLLWRRAISEERVIIKPGNYEAVYTGRHPYGLGKVGTLAAAFGNRDDAPFPHPRRSTAPIVPD